MGTIFQTLESNGNTTITGSLTMSSQQIHSVADPSAAQDAATKNYVDNIALGGVDWKQPVRLTTAAALPSNTYNNGVSGVGATLTATSNAALSVDGIAVVTNDRILVKNEATASHNGIYTVTQTGSGILPYILTRATDYNTNTEIAAGDVVAATAGNTLADTIWIQTSTVTTVGTDSITFSQFGATFPLPVSDGGTGLSTLTAHNVLLGEGTSNVAFAAPGVSNTALVSNGTSSDPSFQAIVNSITGTANQITASSSTGSVTLSIPSTFIAPGSIAATTTLSGTSETLTNTTNQLTLGTTNTTTISATAPSASRTYTLPDAGSAANFVLDQGNYTIAGTWTFSNAVTITPTSNQLILGTTRTTTISATQPATTSRTVTIPDPGANDTFALLGLAQTISGAKTFSSDITLSSNKHLILTDNTTDTVTIAVPSSVTTWTFTLPANSGSNTNVLTTNGSGVTSWSAAGSGTVNAGTATHLSYYATSTNAVSDTSAITSDGTYVTAMFMKANSYTANHTATSTEMIVLANASSGGFTITLPDATTITNKIYFIKKTDTSTNNVTIATTSSQTIDGQTSLILTTQTTIMVVSDGSNWQIL